MDLKTEITAINKENALYPIEWREMPDAPDTLYAVGNLKLLQSERLFTIVGSRQTPASALKLTKRIAQELSETFTIVTGTALGGDSAAIDGALEGSGRVICLLAGGFQHLPQNNLPRIEQVAKHGLVLALHPYETPVREFSYGYRNQYLAKVSLGTLIVGAPQKSGALITAEYAKRYGKKVFALPYFVGTAAGEGCNAVIKSGGILTETAADVYAVFGVKAEREQPIVSLTAEEKALYQTLRENGESHISALCEQTGVPIFKARAILSALEVKGVVVSVGGNRFAPL